MKSRVSGPVKSYTSIGQGKGNYEESGQRTSDVIKHPQGRRRVTKGKSEVRSEDQSLTSRSTQPQALMKTSSCSPCGTLA